MTQKISVLIIEDEKSICDFVAKTLQSHDYKVTTVNNVDIFSAGYCFVRLGSTGYGWD